MARQYLTPPSIPDDIYCRQLQIPNSPEWVGTLTGALYPLCFAGSWKQEDGGITPEAAAERFTLIFNQMFEGLGGCEVGVDVRQSLLDPCVLEKTYDNGATWEAWADLSLCAVPIAAASKRFTPENVRVEDGKAQWSPDGETWIDVVADPIKQVVPQSLPIDVAGDEAKKCLASARVARAYSEAYRATFGAFTAGLFNALGQSNNFLFDLNQSLFNMIYSPNEGILESWLFDQQDFEENYEAPALTAEQEEELTCLLLENTTLIVGERVIFDFGAVRDNLISRLGVNPGVALTYLFDQVGAEATDYAGGSAILASADCEFCNPCDEPWASIGNYNFESGSQLGWGLNPDTPDGTWSGTNWATSGSMPAEAAISKLDDQGLISSITVYVRACQLTGISVAAFKDGVGVYAPASQSQAPNSCAVSGPKTFTLPGPTCVDRVDVSINSANAGNAAISRVTIA